MALRSEIRAQVVHEMRTSKDYWNPLTGTAGSPLIQLKQMLLLLLNLVASSSYQAMFHSCRASWLQLCSVMFHPQLTKKLELLHRRTPTRTDQGIIGGTGVPAAAAAVVACRAGCCFLPSLGRLAFPGAAAVALRVDNSSTASLVRCGTTLVPCCYVANNLTCSDILPILLLLLLLLLPSCSRCWAGTDSPVRFAGSSSSKAVALITVPRFMTQLPLLMWPQDSWPVQVRYWCCLCISANTYRSPFGAAGLHAAVAVCLSLSLMLICSWLQLCGRLLWAQLLVTVYCCCKCSLLLLLPCWAWGSGSYCT